MPPKIPESLQSQRIQKPLTVAQRQQTMIASSPEAQQKAYEERLKQAETYQQQLYADEVVERQRTYYIPRDYLDSRGNPTKAWFNLSAEKKQNLSDRVVKDAGGRLDRYLRRGNIGAYTETYSETTPFSLALYEQRYEKLPEDTKGLFYTRQQIEQKQQENKASVKTQYENRLKELQDRLQAERDRFNERLARYKEKLDKERNPERRRKIKENIDELENDLERNLDRVNYEIRGLQEGFNKFWDKGASFNDLDSYSRAYRRYEEARDRQREQAKKVLQDYKLQNPDFVIKPNVSPLTQLKQLQQGKSGVTVGISEAALKAMKLTPEQYGEKIGTQVKVFKSTQQALDKVNNISFSRPSMEIKPSSQNNVLTYTAAPQPQGFLAKSEAYLKRKSYNQGWYSPLVGAGLSVVGLGTAVKKVFTQSPVKTTQEFVGGTKEIIRRVSPSGEGFPEASQYLQQKPGESIGFIGAEILTGAGTGRLAKTVSTGAEFTFTRFSPKYVPTTPEGILLKETTIKSAGPLSEISVPIKQQAKVIGKPVTAVSAQRDLFGLFEKEKVIRKPIPGEEKLSQATKLELQRFDEGSLSPTEIESLNLKIIKETGSKGLLL